MAAIENATNLICIHCGTEISGDPILFESNAFCCDGCRVVYTILNENGLCGYYHLNPHSGNSRNVGKDTVWNLAELNLMVQNFTLFDSADKRILLFHIPAMHCSSCIWLLERLSELDKGILDSRADFVKKQLKISFNPSQTEFGKIVILLRSIGYEPSLMPEDDNNLDKKHIRNILTKLGVAGFCAGNIMMFSFPQYLGLDATHETELGNVFNGLNVILSIPLVLYCGSDYFKSIATWIKFKTLSVKVPLALGIGALWVRSIFEVTSNSGTGYFDSLAGLIFFLIMGSWLQNRTFDALRFGEKARNFFPLVARTLVKEKLVPKKVIDLVPGDRLSIGHGEIIPADGILMGTEAFIDYSFATGESVPVLKVAGEILLGGGKNTSALFEMEVIRAFDNGRLAEIWKSTGDNEMNGAKVLSFESKISKYFIIGTIAIAILTFIYWFPINQERTWFAVTAVLMVACPCALALAPPFAYNIVANYMAKHGLYLRKPEVVGVIGESTVIVFDKTGTLTEENGISARVPKTYTLLQKQLLYSIASQSIHPYSLAIAQSLLEFSELKASLFKEYAGKGSFAEVNNFTLKLGNRDWVKSEDSLPKDSEKKQVWFSMDHEILAPIEIFSEYHKDLGTTLTKLKSKGLELIIASGDSDAEKHTLLKNCNYNFSNVYFNQSPADKVKVICQLQKKHSVIMVGDGLNDAAALKAGDVGMVVTESTNNFTPQADAILLRKDFNYLPHFISIAKNANRIIKETFVVSLMYNFVAISFAVSGNMSPLLAAILMPTSSIILMFYAWSRAKYVVNRKEKFNP